MDVHALSRSFGKLVNCITTTVTIQNTFTGQTIQTEAIWDTGATNSVNRTLRKTIRFGLC